MRGKKSPGACALGLVATVPSNWDLLGLRQKAVEIAPDLAVGIFPVDLLLLISPLDLLPIRTNRGSADEPYPLRIGETRSRPRPLAFPEALIERFKALLADHRPQCAQTAAVVRVSPLLHPINVELGPAERTYELPVENEICSQFHDLVGQPRTPNAEEAAIGHGELVSGRRHPRPIAERLLLEDFVVNQDGGIGLEGTTTVWALRIGALVPILRPVRTVVVGPNERTDDLFFRQLTIEHLAQSRQIGDVEVVVLLFLVKPLCKLPGKGVHLLDNALGVFDGLFGLSTLDLTTLDDGRMVRRHIHIEWETVPNLQGHGGPRRSALSSFFPGHLKPPQKNKGTNIVQRYIR